MLRGDRNELVHIKEDLDALRSDPMSSEQAQPSPPPPSRSRPLVGRDWPSTYLDNDHNDDDDENTLTEEDDDYLGDDVPMPMRNPNASSGQGDVSREEVSGTSADTSGLSTGTDASIELDRLCRERKVRTARGIAMAFVLHTDFCIHSFVVVGKCSQECAMNATS